MEKKITLKTGAMHCASCEKLIERAAKDVKGVKHVKSDYNTEMTEIVYDDAETDLAIIRAAIEKEGHPTELQAPLEGGESGNDARAEEGVRTLQQAQEPAPEPVQPAAIADKVPEVGNEAGRRVRPSMSESQCDSDIRIAKRNSNIPNPVGNGTSQGTGLNFGTLSLLLGFVAILIGLYLMLGKYVSLDFSSINENTGIAVLLVLGFLTGFHCIGMCGGFVLSYTGKIKKKGDLMPHLQYGAGKTLSYTIIGAAFGLVGSVIAFTTELRGSIAVIAGFFLVLYGLNMLNVVPFLRKLQPRLPSFVPQVEFAGHGPLVTGLLNGLMLACGPLMALYIFAAGTGSPLAGAKALFFFGLGTLVPMLTFGVLSHYFSSVLTRNVVRFSGVMVIVLGLLMVSNGLALLGIGLPISIPSASQVAGAGPAAGSTTNIKLDSEGFQVVKMNVTSRGWEPNSLVVQKGVPVKWEINALELNGCNNEILVRDYGLDIKLKPGLQTVQFTPKTTGVVRFTCWMGMIQGQFVVVDGNSTAAAANVPAPPAGHSCGGGSGGCGCGG